MCASFDKGICDGSINRAAAKEDALSILVPTFRAATEQLAQIKMNPTFCKYVDVDKQLRIQLSVIRAWLENHNR